MGEIFLVSSRLNRVRISSSFLVFDRRTNGAGGLTRVRKRRKMDGWEEALLSEVCM